MSKYLFFQTPSTGHINPSLPVVAELVRRGSEVIYFLPEAFRNKITPTGAEFRPYPDSVGRAFDGLDGTHPALTLERLSGLTVAIVPELLRLIEAERPDAVLHDSMSPWGWLAAKAGGLPSVSSMALLVMTPGMILRSGIVPSIVKYVAGGLDHVRVYRSNGDIIRRTYGVKLPAAPFDFLNRTGTITLSYTTASIQPGAASLGEGFRFVGPIIEPRDDGGFPFDQLDGRPLIYISLGTLTNDRPDFYRACLSAFADGSRQVVMVVPKAIDPAALGDIPSNFIIRSYAPQLDLFPRTTLVICHGGMNTAQEALSFGVPLLMIPQQMEQRMNAVCFAATGAGVLIGRPSPRAAELASAAGRILGDPAFRANAARIAGDMRAAGGARRAADEVLALA